MEYRREIDGLRALAVVPVILFHAGFETFSGGFVGVDIFYVISGYLITTILVEDIENKRFSIINFYERRARRILPALFFVMLCCIPFAWMWMLPNQVKDFSQSVVAVSLFASNILFWRKSDYFAPATEEMPLLHTWSLAVEEQYYVLYPVFLFLAWRCGKSRVFWMIVVFAVVSLALSEWGWRNEMAANFYLAPTRAWEIFAGSIAAFIVRKRGVEASTTFALLGLAAIVFSIFIFDKSTPFPSVYALVPVMGTVLLVLYADKSTVVAKLLGAKLFVGIGLISYSAYLWHQPLFAFARRRSLTEPSEALMLFLSLVSLGLAKLSWKYIEKPFRIKNGICQTREEIFSFSIIGLLIFAVAGLVGYLNSGFPTRLNETAAAYAEVENDINPYRSKCHLSSTSKVPEHPMKGCTDFLVNGSASVIMIGDSHSDAISYIVQKALLEKGLGSYAVSYSGCIGLVGMYRVDRDNSHNCNEYNESMLKYADEEGVRTLIITSRFPLYLEGEWFDNKKGGYEHGMGGEFGRKPAFVDLISSKNTPLPFDSDERKARVKDQYAKSLRRLVEKFNVVLIYPIPEVGWDVPQLMTKATMFDYPLTDLTTSLDLYNERNKGVFQAFDSIQSEKLFRVFPSSVFCDAVRKTCLLKDDKGLFYRDDDHLSSYGAELLTPYIVEAVLKSESRK